MGPGPFYAPIQPWDLMEPMGPFPPWEESWDDREDWGSEGQPVEIVVDMFLEREPISDLMSFVRRTLVPRYGFHVAGLVHAVGSACPEGYDVVSSSRGLVCAYRKKAGCLGGRMDAEGKFVCTEHDYPECPRGMTSLPGSPENWCFPVGPVLSGAGYFVGDEQFSPPDFGPLSRGCPTGSWWDPLQQTCRPIEPRPPSPLPHR